MPVDPADTDPHPTDVGDFLPDNEQDFYWTNEEEEDDGADDSFLDEIPTLADPASLTDSPSDTHLDFDFLSEDETQEDLISDLAFLVVPDDAPTASPAPAETPPPTGETPLIIVRQ